MTELYIPKNEWRTNNAEEIKNFLTFRGISFARWKASHPLSQEDNESTILKAYEHELRPFMDKHGFQSADVINIHPKMDNLLALREKFLSEHTHSEDEVRFFVDGSGKFWFNLKNEIDDDDLVVCVTCTKGDFLSVPQGIKHWFDLAPEYFVKAIRIFTSKEGWVAQYTQSGVDKKYNQV
ncbi:MAG: hypothetical protein QE271_05720 [Bacteriovoracaceae bacterium]|nr:hypothetical protein [Bacteriovoracaceae bacterium]